MLGEQNLGEQIIGCSKHANKMPWVKEDKRLIVVGQKEEPSSTKLGIMTHKGKHKLGAEKTQNHSAAGPLGQHIPS